MGEWGWGGWGGSGVVGSGGKARSRTHLLSSGVWPSLSRRRNNSDLISQTAFQVPGSGVVRGATKRLIEDGSTLSRCLFSVLRCFLRCSMTCDFFFFILFPLTPGSRSANEADIWAELNAPSFRLSKEIGDDALWKVKASRSKRASHCGASHRLLCDYFGLVWKSLRKKKKPVGLLITKSFGLWRFYCSQLKLVSLFDILSRSTCSRWNSHSIIQTKWTLCEIPPEVSMELWQIGEILRLL